MKKIINTVICMLLMLMFTSCEKNTSIDLDGDSNSPVVQEVNSAFSERGVKLGMTEEEVVAVETLNFIIDTSPYSTYVQEDYIHKTIYSETTTKFGDYDAIVTYKFQNNSLYSMEYSININYTKDEIFSTPAYALFLDFTLKYTDLLGNPQISDTNYDYSTWTSYSNVWVDSEIEEEAKYGIYILTNQEEYQSFKDDYSDEVSITFIGFIDE